MNLHISPTDFTELFVPRAFLVVLRRFRPFAVDPDGPAAVLTGSFIPLRVALGLTGFADLRRMIPFSVDTDRRPAVGAVNVVPFGVLSCLTRLT